MFGVFTTRDELRLGRKQEKRGFKGIIFYDGGLIPAPKAAYNGNGLSSLGDGIPSLGNSEKATLESAAQSLYSYNYHI